MTANTIRLKILPGSLILLSVTKKRCQPSPGASLRNKVVSNHGQNQPGLAPFGPPVSKRILDVGSGESVMWPSLCLMLPLAVHLWAVKTLYFHIVLGCQCKTIKERGKLLDLFVLRRLKGLFGWERDKGMRLFSPSFFWWLKVFGGLLGRNSCQPSSRTSLLSCRIVSVHRLLPDLTCGLPDKQLEELTVYWSWERDIYDLEKRERTGSVRPVPAGFLCLMIQKEMPFLSNMTLFWASFSTFSYNSFQRARKMRRKRLFFHMDWKIGWQNKNWKLPLF